MVVRNNSLNQINNLTPALTFSPPLASVPIPDPANPDSIPGNTQITLILAAPIPIDASLNTYTVDGSVSGNLAVNGNPVFDTGANSTDTFDIISGASVTLVTYTPQTVSANQDVAFEVSVTNSGVASVILNQIQTTFEFGGQNFTLDGDQVVSPDTTSLLRFASSTVGLPSGRYQGTLVLVGTENGVPYQDTLFTGIADSLTVQDGTVLAVSSITLSDSVVSQGESGQTLSVRVLNTGESQARILSADSIQFSYNSTYLFSRTSGQSFPFTLNGGDSTLFVYNVDVSPSAVAGQDTFRATIGYEDVNSGVSYTASDPGVYDNWLVLSDVSLNIVSLTATDTRVTQGQSGLAVSLEISNTGETGAVVGSTFLANNNTVTLISPALPDTILPDSSRTYNFTVDINPSAATGIDSLAGFVIGRNISTGAVSAITSSYLDGWNVQTPANIVLTSVFNSLSQVNSGQEDLSVEVRLTNSGQATALLDTVGIFSLPGGNIIDTLIIGSMADSLVSGASDTVFFNVDIASAYTGLLEIDAFTGYRDGNDTSRASVDSGAVNTHTWTVGTEGILVVDSVFTGTTTMSLGQSDVSVRASIRNVGSSSVQIDSLNMLYNGLGTHSVLSSIRVLPATLPLLSTGQSFIAEFNLSAASSPLDSGVIELDLAAYGTDAITGSLIDTLNSEQPDTILLQTPAVGRIAW
jgi:hypothetical protein